VSLKDRLKRAEYRAQYYQTHRKEAAEYSAKYQAEHPQQRKEIQARRYQRLKEALRWYNLTHPCVDCGEKDPIVLEFDHLPQFKKLGSPYNFKSLAKVWAEIQKCEVVCANCHARRTYQRLKHPLTLLSE
jgi:hypothetical protein